MSDTNESGFADFCYGRSSVLGWARTDRIFEQALSRIRYSVHPAPDLNAWAFMDRESGMRVVEIHIGTLLELRELTERVLEWRELFRALRGPKYGRCGLEDLVLAACIDLIVWHEIQHHGLGHVGYFHGAGDPGFSERFSQRKTSSSRMPMSYLDRRACELSADSQAIQFMWRFQRDLRHDRQSRYYRIPRTELLQLFSFSVYLLFAAIGAREPQLHSFIETSCAIGGAVPPEVRSPYPHSGVRAMQIHSLLEHSGFHSWFLRDRRTVLRGLTLAVKLAKSGDITFNVFNPISDEPQLLESENHRIIDHWMAIAPVVERQGLWSEYPSVV